MFRTAQSEELKHYLDPDCSSCSIVTGGGKGEDHHFLLAGLFPIIPVKSDIKQNNEL